MNVNSVYDNKGLKDQFQDNIIQQDSSRTSEAKIKGNEYETVAAKSSLSEPGMATRETNTITYNNKPEVPDGNEQLENNKPISDEDQLDQNGNRITADDYKDITKEGISLEQYDLERLDRALTRIKSQRIEKTEGLEGQKEQLKDNKEAVKDMANGSGINKEVIKKLEDADLPVTDANIAKIANAVEMAEAAIQLPERAITYLVKNKLEPTIQNIYKAQYSGSYSPTTTMPEEAWSSIQAQANDIITDAGLETSTENLDTARWLFNHQLPISEDNIYAVRDLINIRQDINQEDIINKAVKAVALGKTAESANLGFENVEQVEKNIKAFQKISDEAIEITVQDKPSDFIENISAKDLLEAQKQIDQHNKPDKTVESKTVDNKTMEGKIVELKTVEDKSAETVASVVIKETNPDIGTITVRRQLEEIRLKMTIEAGQQLTKNGFHLETDGLSKIIDGLKELEDQYYRDLLKEGNVTVSQDNIDILKGSTDGIEQLKSMPNYILGSTLSSRNIQTVNGLLQEGQEVKRTLENAKEAYETLMTAPRADMGDSIRKAFRNVDDILLSMKLETTNANERAVRILGYNQIEISEENIQNVKSYDQQVNHLINNLQPAVTVELIKSGINPLNIPIEQLNLQIQEIKNELGISKEEKYSKYLWKLEKQKGISEVEKKSYIGIYRLLNAVEKTDGAALGSVLKADQEVTMNNLLTAVRTLKSGGIKADINDDFGVLQEFTLKGDGITAQVEQAFQGNNGINSSGTPLIPEAVENQNAQLVDNSLLMEDSSEKFEYINNLLKDIMEEITPDKLQVIGNESEILDMPAEKLYDNLQQVPTNSELEQNYWSKKVEEYQTTAKESVDTLNLLKSFNIPNSLQNIQAAQDMLSVDQSFFKQWKRLKEKYNNSIPDENSGDIASVSDQLIDSLESSESMDRQYNNIKQEVTKLTDQIYNRDEITSQDLAGLRRFNNGITFLQMLAKRESYEIPISTGDDITHVNVTIIKNGEETGKVKITAASETLGKLNIELSVKDNALKGLILSDNRHGLETLQSSQEEMTQAVEELGIEVKQMNYGLDKKLSPSYSYMNTRTEELKEETDNHKVSTETLYSLAKKLIIQIKNIETRSTYEN